MDAVIYIPAEAGRVRRFALGRGIVKGTLVVKGLNGLVVRAYRRSDAKVFDLAVGKPVDMSSIYLEATEIVTPAGNRGVFEIELEMTISGETKLVKIGVLVTELLLDCDADRDGNVGLNEKGKANWVWGEEGRGAIVLVDNDKDVDPAATLDEREPVVVRSLELPKLPAGVELVLSTAAEAALNISLLRKTDGGFEKVLGRTPGEAPGAVMVSGNVNPNGETLYLQAHAFPGPYFEGLLLFNLHLVYRTTRGEQILAADRILVRVAPWVMTPNTQEALRIYTTRINNGGSDDNAEFLAGLEAATAAEGLALEIIEASQYGDDRWIQDEIEIGYTESHRGTLPVVFDSPRNRGLDKYPEERMLGPDFGHFVVGGGVQNSLDSFGNLEVSPPVIVNGRSYPLGRVIIGGRKTGEYSHDARQMMAEVRQFLYSQRVQFPFELYTDWLAVAHVDEIVSFVSDVDAPKGFRCLVASPAAVKSILKDLQANGHGGAKCFEGKLRWDGRNAEVTVDEFLADAALWEANDTYQTAMDENRVILKEELGLDEEDIKDIPVAFHVSEDDGSEFFRTLAYFPDMVNHLVHKDLSIVPKPYGPLIDGKCAFEKAFEDAVPSRRVTFIDDWYSYHENSGEVHCGTNAQRKPFVASKWWSVRPEGGYDIKALQF